MAGSMRYASSYNFDIVKDGRALETMITYSEGGQPNEKKPDNEASTKRLQCLDSMQGESPCPHFL